MAALRINDQPVVAMSLTLPDSGLWVANLELDGDDVLSGAAKLADDTTELNGFIVRSGESAGRQRVKIVGGAGGLLREIPARSWRQTTARTVLNATLGEAGEKLETAPDTTLQFWSRSTRQCIAAVRSLAKHLDVSWRVLASGTVWMGTNAYQELESEADVLDADERSGFVEFSPETLDVVPGVLWDERRIRGVHYELNDGTLRGAAYYERDF